MPIPASALEPPPETIARPEPSPSAPGATAGPIVAATLGAEETDAVLRLAWELAGRTNADVQVLTALEPSAPVDVQFTLMPPLPSELRAAQRDAQLAEVRAQLCRAAPPGCEWPIAAVDGAPDEAIARFATEHDARVVLVGRGRHGAIGRALSGETVLRLLHRMDVPVYAVEPDVARLARRVVVATDFSAYGVHAARVALTLAAPDAEVTLVHVRPRLVAMAPGLGRWEGAYEEALPALFDRARAALAAPERVQVETVTLTGRAPGHAVIEFAAAAGADLVVSGTHGHGLLGRLMVGSVAADLLRGAPCSFLCVPGSAATHVAALDAAMARLLRESVPSTAWEETARALSARNAGRPCALTLAGPAPGAMRGLPLARIEYDPATRDVALLFGAAGVAGPHLIHVVHDVTAVDRYADASGTDRVVRFAGARGEAFLQLG